MTLHGPPYFVSHFFHQSREQGVKQQSEALIMVCLLKNLRGLAVCVCLCVCAELRESMPS